MANGPQDQTRCRPTGQNRSIFGEVSGGGCPIPGNTAARPDSLAATPNVAPTGACALEINEGLAAYTDPAAAADSVAGAIARAVEILTGADTAESFVRTFAYHTGPAYGLLLDASSPGWRQQIRGTDDFPALLAAAFTVQPAADAAASASQYGGAEIRAAEEHRERGRQDRIAEWRRQFVDGPVLVIRGGGGGAFNSMGVVIPDVGTVFFGPYTHNTESGMLRAQKGVLRESSGSVRLVPAPTHATTRPSLETVGLSR